MELGPKVLEFEKCFRIKKLKDLKIGRTKLKPPIWRTSK
jgi:hypothetical protein